MPLLTINLATFPPRKEGLRRRLKEVAPQCDLLRVYLNGYNEWPADVPLPSNCEYVLGDGVHDIDRGSQGKMFWLDSKADEYYLTIDDDILYPPDYAQKAVAGNDYFGGKAVTGFHGGKFRLNTTEIPEGTDPRKIRSLISYEAFEGFYQPAHLLGNGIMCCRPNVIGLNRDDCVRGPLHSGDDEDIAIWCQKNRVPCIVVPHMRLWLRADPDVYRVEAQFADPVKASLQNQKMWAYKRWQLFPKPPVQNA